MKKIRFYKKQKKFYIKSIFTKNNFISYSKVTLGVILLAFALNFLFKPLNMVTGGIGGIGIIIGKATGVDVSSILFVGNFLLLVLAYFTLGKKYVYKTIYATLIYPVIVFAFERVLPADYFVSKIASELSRNILVAILGALLSGLGIGITINANASTGGIDILQKILNKYFHIPFSVGMYLTDGVITFGALFAGISLEVTLYAFISVLLSGIVVDKIVFQGRLGYTAFVVTESPAYLRIKIFEDLQRSYTNVRVQGGYSKKNKDMLVVSISKEQINELVSVIKKADPKAFSFIVETREIVGYGFRKEECDTNDE